ncbi:MAG: GntR family transcriptional regulator [Acidobacteriia bacterium]|nr:GntR family transcriptional regulator [Terriglobia bacterium]
MTRYRPIKAKLRKDKSATAERGNRVRSAYQQLRELIVHGRLAPGSRIIEADLSHRLGVSRTPVRDALRWLQQEGFVAGNSRTGVKSRLVVAPLTKEDARELYWIVGRIEGLAARKAAELEPSARAALAKRLRTLSDRLRGMARTGRRDPKRVFELDRSFHRNIVEASAGPRLLALHNAIQPQAERYWRLYASAIVDQLATSVAEHARIIRAIAGGDGDAAEHGVEVNWQNGAQRLGSVIDTLGERGSW